MAQKTVGPQQNLPTPEVVAGARHASTELLIGGMIGAGIGQAVGATIAANAILGKHGLWLYHKPLYTFYKWPVYTIAPVIASIIKYHQYPLVMEAALTALGITVACAAPLLFLGYKKMKKARAKLLKSDLHGSAHWADRQEIEAMGILPKAGEKMDPHTCYVGGWHDPKTGKMHYLTHSGPEHIAALAPTRSGKGVGLVIPTLLAWRGSVVVHDIKGENCALTSGWRKSIGQKILCFAPSYSPAMCKKLNLPTSCHFNPLAEIRIGTEQEIQDIQNIVNMIVDPDGKGLNDHWAKTGAALLTGAVLHVLYCTEIKDKTLRAVASLLSNPAAGSVDEIFEDMQTYQHDPDGRFGWTTQIGEPTKTHPVIAEAAQEMLNKADNEKSGVISTAMSFLSLYRDPVVAENIRFSDFKITDLMNADAPVSLYIVVPPSDKDRLKPLVRLMLNQLVRRLTESMEFRDGRSVAGYKHRLLLMIDEFPALGKLDIFAESLAFIAGYGMKAYLICQDVSQLYQAYTREESIISNCHVRVAYAPNKVETAEWLSKMLGTGTVTTESVSSSYQGAYMPYQTGSSGGIQHQARPLLTTDEVMTLKGPVKNAKGDIVQAGAMITMSAGFSPVYGRQILYFLDPVFSKRSKISSPAMSDVISTVTEIAEVQDSADMVEKPKVAEKTQAKVDEKAEVAAPLPPAGVESLDDDYAGDGEDYDEAEAGDDGEEAGPSGSEAGNTKPEAVQSEAEAGSTGAEAGASEEAGQSGSEAGDNGEETVPDDSPAQTDARRARKEDKAQFSGMVGG